jgi:hypothetical protein
MLDEQTKTESNKQPGRRPADRHTAEQEIRQVSRHASRQAGKQAGMLVMIRSVLVQDAASVQELLKNSAIRTEELSDGQLQC